MSQPSSASERARSMATADTSDARDVPRGGKGRRSRGSSSRARGSSGRGHAVSELWACSVCTFHNLSLLHTCARVGTSTSHCVV